MNERLSTEQNLLNIAYKSAKNLMGSDAANQFAKYGQEGLNKESNHVKMMIELVAKKLADVDPKEINKFGVSQLQSIRTSERV